MVTKILKYAMFILLAVSIVLVPLVGVEFYESVGVFDLSAFYTNSREFKKGTSALVKFVPDEDEDGKPVEFDAEKIAETLQYRFADYGYSDTEVTVEDGLLRVKAPVPNAFEAILETVGTKGNWRLDSSSGDPICDQSHAESAKIGISGSSYVLQIKFKDSELAAVKENINDLAYNAYAFLYLDNSLAGYMQSVSTAFSEKNGTIDIPVQYYDSAIQVASIINHGAFEGEFEVVKLEELAPKYGTGALIALLGIPALVILAIGAMGIVKAKKAGIGALLASVLNVFITLTAFANGTYILTTFTYIFAAVVLIACAVFNFYVANTLGKDIAAGKSVSYAANRNFKSLSVKAIIYHVIAFAAAIICFLFATSTFLTCTRIVLYTSIASIITYFVFNFGLTKAIAQDE